MVMRSLLPPSSRCSAQRLRHRSRVVNAVLLNKIYSIGIFRDPSPLCSSFPARFPCSSSSHLSTASTSSPSLFLARLRSAIREMVVRGAPAIAIAAALSLAVEVCSLDFDGTAADSASFLAEKLEYLVSSRPTAVNLSEAATKLQNLVRKVAETASDPRAVLQAYIDAAEVMLIDDVAANKKIGSNGAAFIRQTLQKEVLSILTHCNTGSLATAGYGTALGVIRALHADGVLERAYCTETRPFNQGSRLTAYELVHDKIPATLIADSSAAALMKAGHVSVIIVGADRIAANGDTANKIGTYSLAVSASHHGIPFYVAAPFTSIDQSIPSGEQIVIEERSPKELLHSHGGLGERVAASGIAVWNPAFDVTPASLIAAIITEKGVIARSSEGSFAIKEFLESCGSSEVGQEGQTL